MFSQPVFYQLRECWLLMKETLCDLIIYFDQFAAANFIITSPAVSQSGNVRRWSSPDPPGTQHLSGIQSEFTAHGVCHFNHLRQAVLLLWLAASKRPRHCAASCTAGFDRCVKRSFMWMKVWDQADIMSQSISDWRGLNIKNGLSFKLTSFNVNSDLNQTNKQTFDGFISPFELGIKPAPWIQFPFCKTKLISRVFAWLNSYQKCLIQWKINKNTAMWAKWPSAEPWSSKTK